MKITLIQYSNDEEQPITQKTKTICYSIKHTYNIRLSFHFLFHIYPQLAIIIHMKILFLGFICGILYVAWKYFDDDNDPYSLT